MKNLQEITWYDEEGVFAIIKWDYKNKKLIRKENIEPEKLNPIGDVHIVNGDFRTIPQIVKTVYESTLDNNLNVEIYKKINAFSIGHMLPDYPREEPFDGQTIINFYHRA